MYNSAQIYVQTCTCMHNVVIADCLAMLRWGRYFGNKYFKIKIFTTLFSRWWNLQCCGGSYQEL